MGEKDELRVEKKLDEHIEASHQWRVVVEDGLKNINSKLDKIEVHNQYTKIAIEETTKKTSDLKTAHDNMKGAMAVITFLGLAALADIIKNVFSK